MAIMVLLHWMRLASRLPCVPEGHTRPLDVTENSSTPGHAHRRISRHKHEKDARSSSVSLWVVCLIWPKVPRQQTNIERKKKNFFVRQIGLKNMSLIKCSTTKACSQRSPCPPVQAVWLLPRDHDVNRITWPRIKPSSVWKGVTAGDVPSSKQSKCSKHHLGFNWLQGGQQRGEYMPAFNPACEIPQSDSSPVLWLLPLSLSNSAKCKETVIKSHTWFSFFSPSLKEELLCCFGGLNSFPVTLTGANMLNMTKDYCIDWEILYIWFVTLVIIFF